MSMPLLMYQSIYPDKMPLTMVSIYSLETKAALQCFSHIQHVLLLYRITKLISHFKSALTDISTSFLPTDELTSKIFPFLKCFSRAHSSAFLRCCGIKLMKHQWKGGFHLKTSVVSWLWLSIGPHSCVGGPAVAMVLIRYFQGCQYLEQVQSPGLLKFAMLFDRT